MSNFSITDLLLKADSQFMLSNKPEREAQTTDSHFQQTLSFISPMLPTLVSAAPEGEKWLHEIKYDGYRTQIVLDQSGLRAFTRRGFDWSHRYAAVLDGSSALQCSSAVIDGEVIVQDSEGRSDFAGLTRALKNEPETIVFMAFDLLHLNGHDLRSKPLTTRKAMLKDLIGCHDPTCRLQYVDHLVGGGEAVFQAADALGLEGIVSKRAQGSYVSGRSQSWRKTKCWDHGQFLVLAVEPSKDGPSMALLARQSQEGLLVAGWAAITLPQEARDRFWREAERLACSRAELDIALDRDVRPLRPELRVEARYLKGGDKVRHATLSAIC
jgi:ATP-dependent DNA ligase